MSARSGKARAGGDRVLRPEDVVRWGPVWGRRVGWLLNHVVWNTRVVGSERVPREGAVILAANHTGLIDGPVLHGASPRGSHIIVKKEMFRGVLGVILRWSGQIPVDRRSGRAALTAALALLEEGRVVGIFPEGTRGTGDVAKAEAGIAWLAVRSGAPVVPVALLGTRSSGKSVSHVPRFRTRLYVEFGDPIRVAPDDGGTGRAALGAAMETIHDVLSSHVQTAATHTGVGFPSDEQRAAGHEVTVARRVAAPPSAVWDVVTDLGAAADTLRGVTRVEVLTDGPYAVGTRWRETRRMLGKEATEEMWVTAVEPVHRTVVEAESHGTHYTSTFTLAPAGTGTHLEMRFAARAVRPSRVQRVLWALGGKVGLRATRKALEEDLRDIAAAAGRRAGSP